MLWQLALPSAEGTGLVIPVDGSRFLYTGAGDQTFLTEVRRQGDEYSPRIVWQEPVLKNNHCVPIYHQGHVYGFDGRFLSSVRISDGTVVWKSRPPGGNAVAMVDGHLFVMANDGSVVAIEASPEGYRETGRLKVAEQWYAFTPMSYGSGRLFARDLERVYALRIGPAPAGTEVATVEPKPDFGDDTVGRFLRSLSSMTAERKAEAIDRFWAEHPELPIVTPQGRAHFLYRGNPDDLAIQGDMTGRWPEQTMLRIANSDLYHRAYDLPQDQRWEYRFKVFEESLPDPRNPHQIEGPEGTFSVVQRGRWDEPAPPEPGAPTGRLDHFELAAADGSSAVPAVQVYLPPGYDAEKELRYPLVVFANGKQALEHGRMVEILDRGANEEFAPMIVAFLDLPLSFWWEQSRPRFYTLLDREIFPQLEQRYRLSKKPSDRVMISHEWLAESCLLFALEHPQRFGNLALQSPFFGNRFLQRTLPAALSKRSDLRLYGDWATYDVVNPEWQVDVRKNLATVAQLFRGAGNPVTLKERRGGYGWEGWRTHTGALLQHFFPARNH